MRTVFGSTKPSLRAVITSILSLLMIVTLQFSVMGDADAKKRKSYKRAKVVKTTKVSKRKRVVRKRSARKAKRYRKRIRRTKRARRSYKRSRRYNKRKRRSSRRRVARRSVRRVANKKYAGYVVDANTGKVLYSENANALRYPASLTKMMTVYLLFEDLKAGRIKKTDRVVMTREGARRPPSKIGLRVGQSISVEQAILSLVTKSANDVATAVGGKLSGSEAKFAQRMTRKARQLGMSKTTFRNANGLTAKGQLTTASDMAKLGLALREHFPREYRYFGTRVFKLGKRRYGNHNKLLGRVRGVDGIKTGYTNASGFNLVSSVSSGKRRIVAVVMGGRTGRSRNAHMRDLISRYLPKASTRGSGRLVASARPSVKTSKPFKGKLAPVASGYLPREVPKPIFSNRTNQKIAARIADAHAVSKPKVADIRRVHKQLVAMASDHTPTPEHRPATKATKPSATKTSAIEKVIEKVIEGSQNQEVAKGGWQIQIAASDDRDKAMEMLESVRAKNRTLLSSASTYTEKVTKGGSTLYRARFVGFKSQRSAARACKILKRQRLACLALAS